MRWPGLIGRLLASCMWDVVLARGRSAGLGETVHLLAVALSEAPIAMALMSATEFVALWRIVSRSGAVAHC
jgi:hypothetical protein